MFSVRLSHAECFRLLPNAAAYGAHRRGRFYGTRGWGERMTLWRTALAIALGLTLLGGQFGNLRQARAADDWNVDSWIELSSTAPASGCGIDASIEVRSDGYVVPGVDVFIGLFVDSNLISADRVSTDDNGVAWLSFDTSLADGDDAWVDVTLNDTYWWGTAVYPGSGARCYDSPLQKSESGWTDASPSEPADSTGDIASVAPVGNSSIIPEVGFYVQQRNLSCEYASIHIATAAWGRPISEYDLDNLVGWSDNPHLGYRGDITGWWGN